MSDELKRFFKSIDFEYTEEEFLECSVKKVIYLKQKDLFEVYIHLKNVLPVSTANALFLASKNKINHEKECVIHLEYDKVSQEDVLLYLKEIVKELVKKRPSLVNLSEAILSLEDEIITMEVGTKLEEQEVKREGKNIASRLLQYGLGEYEITSKVNEELNNEVKKDLEMSKTSEIPIFEKEEKTPIINGEITTIANILGDMKNVIVEAYVFGIDTMEHEKVNIITLKISDKTNSLIAKVFKRF